MNFFRALFGSSGEPPLNQEKKVSVMGLPGTGKNSFVQQIVHYADSADVMPLDQRSTRVQKNSTTMKFRVLDGERNRRGIWTLLSNGSKAIVYMVDAANAQKMLEAKNVFHYFLRRPEIVPQRFSVLVLGNKSDLAGSVDETALIELIGVNQIQNRDVGCFMVSCRTGENIQQAFDWLIAHLTD